MQPKMIYCWHSYCVRMLFIVSRYERAMRKLKVQCSSGRNTMLAGVSWLASRRTTGAAHYRRRRFWRFYRAAPMFPQFRVAFVNALLQARHCRGRYQKESKECKRRSFSAPGLGEHTSLGNHSSPNRSFLRSDVDLIRIRWPFKTILWLIGVMPQNGFMTSE